MNIELQACGFLVILLLILLYRSQKTLRLFRERVFAIVLNSALLTLFMDILSVLTIHQKAFLPNWLVQTVARGYLLMVLISGFSALFYVVTDLIRKESRMRLFRFAAGVLVAEGVAVCIAPVKVFVMGSIAYTYDVGVLLTYLFALIYVLSTLITAIVSLRKINLRRAAAVVVWMLLWIGSAAFQFFHEETQLIGFAGALGMMILYITLESPEANTDRQFGCFNSYAFDVYCGDLKDNQKKFALMEIAPVNQNLLSEMNLDPVRVPTAFISRISALPGVHVFKNVDYSIYAVSENVDSLKAVYETCVDVLDKRNLLCQMEFYLFRDSDLFANSAELSKLIAFARQTFPAERMGELLDVTGDVLDAFRRESLIAEEIRSALKEDRILVYLQPIYAMKSSLFETAEALVRIESHDGRLMSPGVFIPVAEKTGQIVELGNRIFEKVCEFIAENDLRKLGMRYIEVNLSVVQCERAELRTQLTSIMRKYGVPSEMINFEITETASVKTKSAMIENMTKINQSGASFSLDDFGKGESNLIYLIDMPVSILKLDYELSKSYTLNDKAPYIIRSIVNLAHSLGMSVVAEGIETRKELEIYRRVGVDYIQGYYFSRPLPMPDFVDFIRQCNGVEVWQK